MSRRITTILSLLFLTTCTFGQTTSSDSLSKVRDSLKSHIRSFNKLIQGIKGGCSNYEIHRNPKWVNDNLSTKTYYRNCRNSGAYVVLEKDSIFLFKYNGEGSANYLQKGKWEIINDSILALKGIDKLTLDFKLKMKRFEKTKYRSSTSFIKTFIRREDMLIEVDNMNLQMHQRNP